ncbi:MAG: cytochrome c3 family protein [bacterium]
MEKYYKRILLISLVFFLPIFITLSCVEKKPRLSLQKKCIDCHKERLTTIKQKKVVHRALDKDNCEACHRDHGILGVLRLWKYDAELCYECHKQKKSDFNKRYLHSPVKNGKCTSCHDPHSSDNVDLITQSGNEHCLSCHKGKQFKQKYIHSPIIDKDKGCTTCHNPHAGDNEAQLVKPIPELCLSCHSSDTNQFKSSHQGYDVSQSNCYKCHNPHSSDNPKLFHPSTHKPVLDKNCSGCHVSQKDSKQEVLANEQPASNIVIQEEGASLCYKCHQEVKDKMDNDPVKHPPATEGKCNNCHDPHATPFKFRLLKQEDQLCYECHQQEKDIFNKKYIHSPIKNGKCIGCHHSHSSENKLLVRQKDSGLCFLCHDEKKNRSSEGAC